MTWGHAAWGTWSPSDSKSSGYEACRQKAVDGDRPAAPEEQWWQAMVIVLTVTVFITHLVLSGWEVVCYYYPPLTDENSEAQRGPTRPPCHPSVRDVRRHDLSPCMGGLGQQRTEDKGWVVRIGVLELGWRKGFYKFKNAKHVRDSSRVRIRFGTLYVGRLALSI